MSAPLILAIQPDRRQQTQLASIARQVSAELLLTESTARAIVVLGERLPDLILTPPLLSHKDETALTERLREFGSAGAHIQTLTIPILETDAEPARKGMLSSLRKPKRKGRPQASETVGCTADTFAEQVSVYLTRAIAARRATPPVSKKPATASPAATTSSEPEVAQQATQTETIRPATAASVADQLVRQPETAASVADRLPTIEQLSARTPAVPEPARAVATRIEALTALVRRGAVLPAPLAAPVETRMDAIAALVPRAPRPEDAALVPVPEGTPHVARLSMKLPPSEMALAIRERLLATPAPPSASVETTMNAVAAMVPLVRTAKGTLPVPMPGTTPPAAAVRIDLSSVDKATGKLDSATLMLPAASIETTLDAVAAMVPLAQVRAGTPAAPMPDTPPPMAASPIDLSSANSAAGTLDSAMLMLPAASIETRLDAIAAMLPLARIPGSSPAPVAAIPQVSELAVELPRLDTALHLHTSAALVSAPPAGSVEMSIAAVAAMMPGAAASTDRTVPVPAVTPHVAALAMTLPPAETVPVHAVIPDVPQAASVEMSMQAVTGMMSGLSAHNHHQLAPLPASAAPVKELTVRLTPSEMLASANQKAAALPAPPASLVEATIDTVAAIAPLARTATRNASVPVPALVPYVADLPMPLAAMTASGRVTSNAVVVPPPSATLANANMAAMAALVSDVAGTTDERESPAPSTVEPAVRRKTKKKATLKERKAARKLDRNRSDRLDESSLFDPDECRFAALVAKLDEVVADTDGSPLPATGIAAQPRARKRRTAARHA